MEIASDLESHYLYQVIIDMASKRRNTMKLPVGCSIEKTVKEKNGVKSETYRRCCTKNGLFTRKTKCVNINAKTFKNLENSVKFHNFSKFK